MGDSKAWDLSGPNTIENRVAALEAENKKFKECFIDAAAIIRHIDEDLGDRLRRLIQQRLR